MCVRCRLGLCHCSAGNDVIFPFLFYCIFTGILKYLKYTEIERSWKKKTSYTHIHKTDLNKEIIVPHLVRIFFKGNKTLHCEVIFVTLMDHISLPLSLKYVCVCMHIYICLSVYLSSIYLSSLFLIYLSIHPPNHLPIIWYLYFATYFFPISQY